MNNHFLWITDPPLVTDVFKPWYLIAWSLNGTAISKDQIEGHLLKGKGRQIYYIVNQTKYGIPDGDTFEGLGFDWSEVWHLSDVEVNYFPDGGDIKSCDKNTCIDSAFYRKRGLR
jgi:hypothetical protein